MQTPQVLIRLKNFLSLPLKIGLVLSVFIYSGCIHKGTDSNLKTNETDFKITIAHINDTHAHLDSTETMLGILGNQKKHFNFYAQLGGYSRLKYKLIELRESFAKNKHPFMVLNGGDAFQGSLYFTKFQGEEEARLFSEMKIDAMVLGNHEFDLGNLAIQKFANKINFPILASNLIKSRSKVLKDVENIKSYEIREFNGEKVGIFGILIESMGSISSPDSDTQFVYRLVT